MMTEISQEVGVGILASLIGAFTLMLRWATQRFGKPATNQALDIASKSMSIYADLKDAISELKDATITMKTEIVNSRLESTKEHTALMETIAAVNISIKTFHTANSTEHAEQSKKLATIEPAITTLVQQIIQTENRVDAMNNTVGTQDEVLKEILQVVNDMKQEVTTLVDEFRLTREENRKKDDAFEGRLEKAESNIDAFGDDIRKRITLTTPVAPTAPANQPVVMPIPTTEFEVDGNNIRVKKIESKPKDEKEETK